MRKAIEDANSGNFTSNQPANKGGGGDNEELIANSKEDSKPEDTLVIETNKENL